jgi:nucleotide-binding universal stress UspA family protein
MAPNPEILRRAVLDFQYARQRAAMEEVLARLTGKSNELLSFDEISQKLKLKGRADAGNRSIPVDAIVGSVGRYTDFTRTFLPRHAKDQERWSRVKAAFMDPEHALPPIEVYKVGEVYFVLDGNHRVSIARQEGVAFIDAHVIEINANVPITVDTQPDELIARMEYAAFLEVTGIMDLRPNVDLSVTIPGQYEKMIEQIRVRQYQMQQEGLVDVSFQDAVGAWYDQAYIPLAETIRDRGLLNWCPDRTLTDLCMWILENRSLLEKEAGWEMHSDAAATDLILKRKVREQSGSWRKARIVSRYTEHLFVDILVPLSGDPGSWDALEQAISIARHEGAKIHGLHVVDSPEHIQSSSALACQAEFDQRCANADVEGKLVIEAGELTQKIRERANMADLVVLKIVHPPRGGLSTLRSPFRTVIINSSRPVLGVPKEATPLKRALLAYDGSLRAKEALFVATYLAETWKTRLTVFTSLERGKIKADTQDYVRRYLEIHEVGAEYVLTDQDAMQALKMKAEAIDADLILMGSYGRPAWQGMVIGSCLDTVLRESTIPVFICR